MKARFFNGDLATYMVVLALMLVISLNSCSGGGSDDPVPIVPPVVPTVMPPVAVIKPAINVGLNSATLVAKFIPNGDNVTVSFEYKTKESTDWVTNTLPTKYSGKDSIKVTLDLSNLTLNTEYNVRIKVVNKAGTVTSDVTSFKTYGVTDYDGNMYHLVTIGTQTWLQENLKTTHFANGDLIPNVTDNAAWVALTTPGYCYYDNDPKNGPIRGCLYNFYVAFDSRGFIKGYHVATADEWETLSRYNESAYGNDVWGSLRAAPPIWNGNNKSGFSVLKSGWRDDTFVNQHACFWTSTPYGPNSGEDIWFWDRGGDVGACSGRMVGEAIRLIKN